MMYLQIPAAKQLLTHLTPSELCPVICRAFVLLCNAAWAR